MTILSSQISQQSNCVAVSPFGMCLLFPSCPRCWCMQGEEELLWRRGPCSRCRHSAERLMYEVLNLYSPFFKHGNWNCKVKQTTFDVKLRLIFMAGMQFIGWSLYANTLDICFGCSDILKKPDIQCNTTKRSKYRWGVQAKFLVR